MVSFGAGPRRRIFRLGSRIRWLIAWTLLVGQTPPPAIQYLYDDNGRLIAVIDPSASQPNAAVYNYDAVGNITSIERRSSATVSVLGFSPPCGSIGTTVTIYGTGFSSTASQNTVNFGSGPAATATSATTTQLTAAVPSGSTTGVVTVTAPSGTGSSPSSWRLDACGAPTVTAVVPNLGDPGAAVTFTGTNFGAQVGDNRVAFNGRGAAWPTSVSSTTSLTANVGLGATSGRVSVTTRFGTGTGPDFFVPPAPPPGQPVIVASSVQFTSRMSIGGSSLTVPISTSGKVGLVVFDGSKGQRVRLGLTNDTMGTVASIYNPDGTILVNQGGGFIDTATLPAMGTYTILIDPPGSATGSVVLTLYDIIDVTGTITPGGSAVPVSITVVGQNARLTFTATAGQRVSLAKTNDTLNETTSILKPDGTVLASANNTTTFLDVQTLPTAGTYIVFVDATAANTGNITVTLYSVPPDCNPTLVAGGGAVTAAITTPGQNCRLPLSGAAGQRVSIAATNVIVTETMSFLKPDGTTLATESLNFIDTQTLPVAGTYVVLIDGLGTSTGSVTITAYNVPDCTGTIAPGGSGVTSTVSTPGQNCSYTFSGTTGQRISVAKTSDTLDESTGIVKPNGSLLGTTTSSFLEPQTLPTNGTYSVLIDGRFAATGSVTTTAYDVPADGTGTITINGAGVSVTIATPGQNWQLTFNGTAGQQVTGHGTSNTIGSLVINILNPNGSTLTSQTWSGTSFNMIPKTLTATGMHTLVIDPTGAASGSITMSVTNP